uniref:BUD13 homolog n=1 Tax=Panagrolaimus sp. ES5 TaxID=591445 RepID=A0AC34FHW2_9BILA
MASADYLKKYLSNSKSKKNKKSKKSENLGGLKVVEDDAFIMVKPRSRGMPSDEEEEIDETEEEIREKQKQAEKLKFRSDTFQPVEDISSTKDSVKNGDENSRRKQRYDSDGDITPPRRRQRHDSDTSPPRRKRHDSDRDESPPRRRQERDSDASPPRRQRQDSDREKTPPRRRQRHDSDTSPPRRKRHDRDESPPRRSIKREPDTSPPRRRRHNSYHDTSPPRRSNRHDSDESPPRRSIKREPDASPPRRNNHRSSPGRRDRKSPIIIRKRSPPSPSQVNDDRRSKTLDGKKAGLVSAQEMRKELGEHRTREKNAIEGLDDELTGRFAETKIRTKLTGRNRKGTKEDEDKKAREEKKNEELKEKYEKWNRGITQLKQREAQVQEEERVMKEGFSRYADDEAMNEHLRDEILPEDPMAALISKKREKVEMRKGLVYPSYKGHWPPNRYNIAPGYRWDGVNRSNGFEAQLSLAGNKRKADEEAAYRAITECAE